MLAKPRRFTLCRYPGFQCNEHRRVHLKLAVLLYPAEEYLQLWSTTESAMFILCYAAYDHQLGTFLLVVIESHCK